MINLICGITLDKVFKIEKKIEAVTKFNEETGIPYEKVITNFNYYFLNKKINKPKNNDPTKWNFDSFKITRIHYESYYETHKELNEINFSYWIAGVLVGSIDKYKTDFVKFEKNKLNEYHEEVKKVLLANGFDFEPSFYLVDSE